MVTAIGSPDTGWASVSGRSEAAMMAAGPVATAGSSVWVETVDVGVGVVVDVGEGTDLGPHETPTNPQASTSSMFLSIGKR